MLTHPERFETMGFADKVVSLPNDEFREMLLKTVAITGGSTTWATLVFLRTWVHAGRNIFKVGRELTRMLEDTDICDAPVESLKLPYDCVYLDLPECSYEVHSGTNGWLPIRGIYLCKPDPSVAPELGTSIMVGIWGPGGRYGIADDSMSWKLVNLAPDKLYEKDGISYVDFQKQVLDSVSERPWVETLGGPGLVPIQIALSKEEVDKTKDMVTKAVALAINLLFYITSEPVIELVRDGPAIKAEELRNAKRKTGKKRDGAIARATKLSSARIYYIGREYEGGGFKVTPHMRRGHWHHYWTGSRTGLDGLPRKGEKITRKWIRPVPVGAGDPEPKPRVYKVG